MLTENEVVPTNLRFPWGDRAGTLMLPLVTRDTGLGLVTGHELSSQTLPDWRF